MTQRPDLRLLVLLYIGLVLVAGCLGGDALEACHDREVALAAESASHESTAATLRVLAEESLRGWRESESGRRALRRALDECVDGRTEVGL